MSENGSYSVSVVVKGNDGKFDFRIEDSGVFVITGGYNNLGEFKNSTESLEKDNDGDESWVGKSVWLKRYMWLNC